MRNLKTIKTLLLLLCLTGIIFSCTKENDINDGQNANQTIFLYMPWSGDNLYSAFLNNIKEMERAIKNDHSSLKNKRLLVFISQSAQKSILFEIALKSNKCVRDTLQEYGTLSLNTAQGISNVLRDIKRVAPAPKYAMLIGGHGMGWLPAGTKVPSYTLAKPSSFETSRKYPRTRFFGHQTEKSFQTDISTLAIAIENENMHMTYILFDDCYMANIETAYELRNVTDYLIASTSEIFLEGIHYETAGAYLLKNDFNNVCQAFYKYYNAFNPPCGALSVTDCRQTEKLAEIMKQINNNFTFNTEELGNIQVLDGLTVSLFFDLADYVRLLCKDENLLSSFNSQLNKTVIYKVNTPTLYSDHNEKRFPIRTYSGLTVSEPSQNAAVTKNLQHTSWFQNTH